MPGYVLIAAVLVSVLHMAPVWRAQSQTPPGWIFTGNYSVSPDHMQYRVWFRQTEDTGIVVSNAHTTEPNTPHLLVIPYYLLGQVSRWTQTPAMLVYHYAGAVLAFALTLLLFATVRHFLGSPLHAAWVFLATLVGGGLGAHMKIISGLGPVAANEVVQRLIVQPLQSAFIFEDHRGIYTFITLFDTHYSLIWIMLTLSLLSAYWTLRAFSSKRLMLTAFLYVATPTVHLYEGPTLVATTAAIAALCWAKGLVRRPSLIVLGVGTVAVGVSLLAQVLLYRTSGLPLPPWRAPSVHFSVLLIAYPLAWALIAWGLGRYWRDAGLKECFLLGWTLGCVVLVLAGPFYPYPDRGAMTLQIPIFIIAGSIYFTRIQRTTRLGVLMAILLLAATPTWLLVKGWQATGFQPNAPYMYLSSAHQEIVGLLQQRASRDDVLLVDKSKPDWRTHDDLWLAPDYPGKWYASHYFLTVDYDHKVGEVARFFRGSPEEQGAFLREKGVRFLYVDASGDPLRFNRIPGLALVRATSAGSLFEYCAQPSAASE